MKELERVINEDIRRFNEYERLSKLSPEAYEIRKRIYQNKRKYYEFKKEFESGYY